MEIGEREMTEETKKEITKDMIIERLWELSNSASRVSDRIIALELIARIESYLYKDHVINRGQNISK